VNEILGLEAECPDHEGRQDDGEIRPAWRGPPHQRHESAVAKATFVRSRNVWRVFWQRRDLKWHGYEPAGEVNSFDDFLSVVAEDRHACFFG
jgi:hypothetical protein